MGTFPVRFGGRHRCGSSPVLTLVLGLAIPISVATASASDGGRCKACHPGIVESYQLTGMGRSMQSPGPDHPTGVYRHGLSGTSFQVSSTSDGLVQVIERAGISARYPVEFVIGSGNAAFGYIVRAGDAAFQSPLTYYTEHGRWGMAPGMEWEAAPDFDRPVTAECLWCHAGRPIQVPRSLNRYREPIAEPAPISCDRCHGPSDRHLVEPSTGSIFNPAHAPHRERDSVCEQCHLGGLVRVPNPGQSFASFEPGRRLEEFWSVFLGSSRQGSGPDKFQVVSHVEQLALSRCAQQSGDELWCGTCHDPHQSPADPLGHFAARCLTCHAQSLPDGHSELSGGCASCHMSRRQSHDSGHSAFTDHRISRHPIPEQEVPAPGALRPWRPIAGPLGRRNLGVANVLQGQRQGSLEMVRRGLRQLRGVLVDFPRDETLLDALGTALLINGKTSEGRQMLERAIGTGRAGALQHNALAAAWLSAGRPEKAVSALEEAIGTDPSLESSYRVLARIHREGGSAELETQTWQRLLRQRPRLINARLELMRAARESKP